MANDLETGGKVSLGKLSIAGKDLSSKMESLGYPEDLSGEVAGLAWRHVLRKSYFNGKEDGSPIDDVDSAVWESFQAWANDSRLDDLGDLLFIREDGSPLSGSPHEAALNAHRLVRETEFQRDRLAALLFYTLAPTLRRWETARSATPEQQADFLLPALGGGVAPNPRPLSGLVEFGARLWRRLGSQQDRDIDYWKTVRSFGDFFVRAKGTDTLALAAEAYHVLIQALQPSAADAETANLIRGAANNLGSLLADLFGKTRGGAGVEIIAAAADLHVMASAAIDGRNAMKQAERRALALDDLGNTPAAFQRVSGDPPPLRYLRQAWFSARAGAVRARLREPDADDAKDVASAFFNAGVALLRGGFRRQPAAVAARITVNAIGLWWSLRLADNDDAVALGRNAGSDCAVNLMGALTDIETSSHDALQPVLMKLWNALAARRHLLGADFLRIEASAREMKLMTHPAMNGEPLLGVVVEFLLHAGHTLDLPRLTRMAGEPGAAAIHNDRRQFAFLSWLAVAAALRPLTENKVRGICLPVWSMLNQVPPHLADLPEAIAANWLTLLNNRHPLVAAELMTTNEVAAILSRGEEEPASLGEWLEKNAWELAGAMARDGT